MDQRKGILVEHPGSRRVGGEDVGGPPPFTRITKERELGYHEDAPAGIPHREVHLALCIGEYPQIDDLVAERDGILVRIVSADSKIDEKA